ncbi:hypothetical protein [Trinickia sp. Y13]|uniref:hypothetical protein n=1 Tax=Trinickia sp. Y13 TaxID=2917807 RepID=UPI002406F288|nr:hypothetical protein [Trinickia sp. Y13]MDG0027200.1 hypothetical protein [Trinickia sp. Y13]
MSHPPLATHMVSLPDGKTGNNALGYCTSTARDPSRTIVLTPIGRAWPKRVFKGIRVAVKWLKLPGQPEFLHILDGETSTTMALPRRLQQRATGDLVAVRTVPTQHYPADIALYYGTASAPAGNLITVSPLSRWLRDLPAGSAVELVNLSAPGNALRNGLFGTQASIAKNSSAGVRLLKDSPGG